MIDAYNLQRFVDAQNPVFERVLSELGKGHKSTHWMWFIFPQIKGLGHSETARRYGIASRGEAEAYLDHQLLGPRLRQCTDLVNRVKGRSIEQIFGHPDCFKFRSCMTLFSIIAPDNEIFQDALRTYFNGEPDSLTIDKLQEMGSE